MTTHSKPQAYTLLASVLCFAYLMFIQPFATQYEQSRATIWSLMRKGFASDNAEWSFGYFVPLIVMGLLWMTKDRFEGLKVKGSAIGIPVLLIGFFFYFAGYKANEHYIGYGSLYIIIAGIILWHLGIQYFFKGLWLWFLLGMMFPWIFLIDVISFPLQRLMTGLTSFLLKIGGEDFIKEGTSIMSSPTEELETGERFSLKVAAACSGLRSFFALAMVSLFYGYITLKKDLNRLILFISSGVFAILGNIVRMMLLYWGTLLFGKEFAIGKGEEDPSMYHIGAGLVVFVVALSCMIALSAVLERGKKKKVVSRQV